MDAGKLDKKLSMLAYCDGAWVEAATIWGSVEQSGKGSLFSSVGVGALSAEFIIRRRTITLHNALRWRGQHCFLTAITDEGKAHLRLASAIIEPTACTAYRSATAYNAARNPIRTLSQLCTFYACVTEKYAGFTVQQPQTQLKETLVVITPKSVELRAGDLVDIGTRGRYAITLAHTIDEYKNEYEAQKTGEA